MGLQPVELLADVGLGGEQDRLLMQPVLVEAARGFQQRRDRLRRAARAPPRACAPDCRRRPASARRWRRAARRAPRAAPRPRRAAPRPSAAIASSRLSSAPAQTAAIAASSSTASTTSTTPRTASTPSMVGGARPDLSRPPRAPPRRSQPSERRRPPAPATPRPRAAPKSSRNRCRAPAPCRSASAPRASMRSKPGGSRSRRSSPLALTHLSSTVHRHGAERAGGAGEAGHAGERHREGSRANWATSAVLHDPRCAGIRARRRPVAARRRR